MFVMSIASFFAGLMKDQEPVQELDQEPVQELDQEPVQELDQEPVQELDQEPVQELDQEPVQELDQEPVQELDPVVVADTLARRLHTALVLADGRIANPNDVPYDPTHLDSEEALTATIDALVESNPGARARQYNGDIGAGTRGNTPTTKVDLISLMRNQ